MEELSVFAFLIGKWDCNVTLKNSENQTEHHKAIWTGRYILDENVFQDEYRETDEKGELIRLGINIRAKDQDGGWTMKWFDAITSTWLDLGPKELGGVTVNSSEISFQHFAPDGIIVRITFFNIQENRFSWKADITTDQGVTWEKNVFTIEASRVK